MLEDKSLWRVSRPPPPLSDATIEHAGRERAESAFLSESLYAKSQGSKCFSYPPIVLFPVK